MTLMRDFATLRARGVKPYGGTPRQMKMRYVTVTFMSDCQCIAILTQVTVTFTLKGSSKNSKNFSLRTQSKKRKVRKALI